MSIACEETVTQQDVPDLVPARMLNEFAYCPRLAYLEWVQGEFADNLETLEGRFGHRRVDQPDRQEVPEAASEECKLQNANCKMQIGEATAGDSPEVLHSRSVMLSAPSEKLIAKIDVLDLENSVAVPIDYKRGRVPDVPGNAWEPERVQLCAQGIILRENGYQCEGGILYFIDSRRRVSIPFDDELVDRTRELLGQMLAMAAGRRIPPPLDDSPKCPRCSLVGICLPDETRLLACPKAEPGDNDALTPGPSPEGRGEADVRRLTPARDDALPLYVQDQGVTLGKSGDQLTVKSRQQTLRQVKMIDVSQVSLFGNVQVTAQALREITAAGIPVCHFSYGGWFHAVTHGMEHKNVELRMRQFAVAADPTSRSIFAKTIRVGQDQELPHAAAASPARRTVPRPR